VGYPKLNKDDKETVFTLQLGKFGAKLYYDPFISLSHDKMLIKKQSRKVTCEMSNNHQNEIQSLLPSQNHEGYYPPVVISFATRYREGINDEGAGPGLVYASKFIALFDKEHVKSYSNLHSTGNSDYLQLRLSTAMEEDKADKCKVFVALLSPAYLQSIDCLDEFHMAIKREREKMCKIITINSEDISSEKKDWWNELKGVYVNQVDKSRRSKVTEYLQENGCVRQGELVGNSD
jgi:hypothetical protein